MDLQVSNASRFGAFIKLLARWRGSIYKLIYVEYIFINYVITF